MLAASGEKSMGLWGDAVELFLDHLFGQVSSPLHPLTKAAKALGLTFDGDRVRGQLDGIEVAAWVSDTDTLGITEVTCSAALPRTLGIGLALVGRRDGDNALGPPALRVATRPGLERLRVSARERKLAAELLSGAVEELLLEATRGRALPRIDDDSVALTSRGTDHNPTWMLRTSVRLALALQRARSVLPATDHEKALQECWESVARSTGAKFDPLRERLVLDLGSARLRVALKLDAGGSRETKLDLEFPTKIAEKLSITNTEDHGKWDVWVGGELKLGDEKFDAAFVVRGAPEERMRSLLSAKIRADLCELATLTDHLVLREDGLEARVGRVVTEPEQLSQLLNALTELAESLTHCDQRRGPYR